MAPPAALPGGCLECSRGSQELEGDVEGRFPLNPTETPEEDVCRFSVGFCLESSGCLLLKATFFLALWLGTLAARLPLGFSRLGVPAAP